MMHGVIDFLFPTGRQPLRMDLLRWVFLFVVFLFLGWRWNDFGLPLVMGAAFLARTLIEHVYWHYHPPKPAQPVTRYTNPRYNKEH
jgi:hypothetical protein